MTDIRTAYDQTLAMLTQPGSPFEITREMHNGHHVLCYPRAPRNLASLLAPAREHGDKPFALFEDECLSFNAFFDRADRLAMYLLDELGINPGDPVAIAMRNYPEWLVAYVAIASIGAVVVPLNSFGRARETHDALEDTRASVVICDKERLVLIDQGDFHGKRILVRSNDAADSGAILLDDAIAGRHVDRERIERLGNSRSPDDTAIIMFTSGTSGRPKGARVSHFNVCQSITNFELGAAIAYYTNREAFDLHLGSGRQPRTLVCVPLFHISGMFAAFLLSLRGGRGLVLMYKWDVAGACALIRDAGVSVISAAPQMVQDLIRHPDFADLDTGHVSNVSAAGAATPAKLNREIKEKFPAALGGAGWGMTETCGTGASFTGAAYSAKPGASGFVNPILEFRFCDADGNDVGSEAPGGEMWVRGPSVVDRYINADESNRSDFRDGWFRTGDMGYLDEDGCLCLNARAKEMIIRSGENVYPAEVEHCIQELDGVVSAAGFGIASEAHGEDLVVVVQVQSGRFEDISQQRVLAHCKEHLASYKVPAQVFLTEEPMPLNATNKVVKAALKQRYCPV